MVTKIKCKRNLKSIADKSAGKNPGFEIKLSPVGFIGFYWVFLGFIGFYWGLLGFIGFYWVLLGFIGVYWVL